MACKAAKDASWVTSCFEKILTYHAHPSLLKQLLWH